MKKEIKVKVIGIGGAGGNILSRIKKFSPDNFLQLIAFNTDLQDLKTTKADLKLQIGKKKTRGLGAGMDPKIGQEAAEESKGEIQKILKGSDILFLISGLGGGTGSGASPIVARLAKETNALTIGIFTFPFYFEGEKRKRIAQKALELLEKELDSFIIVFNDKILSQINPSFSFDFAFSLLDKTIQEIIFSITQLLVKPGLINIDLADLTSILKGAKRAYFGIGKGRGEQKIKEAIIEVLNSPFLDISIEGAKGVLLNIVGGKNLTLFEVARIVENINQKTSPEAKIIFGAQQNNKTFQPDEVQITLIASGL